MLSGLQSSCTRRFTPFYTPLVPEYRRRTIENGGRCERLRSPRRVRKVPETKCLLSFSEGQRAVSSKLNVGGSNPFDQLARIAAVTCWAGTFAIPSIGSARMLTVA